MTFVSKWTCACLLDLATSWNACKSKANLETEEVGVDVLQAAIKAAGLATAKTDGVTGGAEVAIATLLSVHKPEDFLAAWVAAVGALDRLPVIVIDEANMAFPSGNGNGNVKKEVAREALQALVALAKQNRKVSVILIASDYAFPLGLEELGFNKFDCVRSMVCPEVEEEAMLKVLAEWGLSEDLAKARSSLFPCVCSSLCEVAEEFYESFGGNVFLCDQAIDKLRWQFSMGEEELFDPVSVQGNDGLGDLVGGSLTRQHMVNLADKRWSPIQDGSPEEETESQAAARIIAKKNFGAIINKKTTTFLEPALKEEMFRDPYVQRVLIPPTTYARKSIQSMVKTMKPSASDVKFWLFPRFLNRNARSN